MVFFHIFPNFSLRFCKQTEKILIIRRVLRRKVASDLDLLCLLMSHKKDARLIWVKGYPFGAKNVLYHGTENEESTGFLGQTCYM